MKIRNMTATFGCLDHAGLELHDGVNVLTMDNESGKSTWAEFLTAMFYGLDPRRSAKGRLSHKERFSPWSGKSMEGTVELSMEGRTILLQRTSEGGKPFGTFKAWDKQTGLEIPSLTAENCGYKLIGVEREVFRRSAFLAGTELMVTPDHDLSRRLESLAAAGRETDSFLRADKVLHSWQNQLRYNHTGEIPKLEQQKKELELAAQCPVPDTGHLPSEEELLRLLAGLQLIEQTPAACPPALAGLTQEQILPKVHRDLMKHRLITLLFAVAAVLFVLLSVAVTPYLLIGTLLCLGIGIWNHIANRLPKQYGVARQQEILPAAIGWRDWEKRRMEQQLLVEQVRRFAPEVASTAQAVQAVQQAIALHRQAAQIRANRPDPARIEELETALAKLRRKEQAILLARQALAGANMKLQQTYVPQLTKLAGTYLRALTLGRYSGLVMNEQMELSIREADGLLRPLAAVSTGTKDQTWLALRLAMTKLLLPEKTPLVLDDALLTFDAKRQKAAMEVLKKEERQIIVFSCK